MKKAIIIGATSGIGKELAKLLVINNYKVGITGRRLELLNDWCYAKHELVLSFIFFKIYSSFGGKANIGSSFPVQFLVNNTSDLKIKSGMFGKVNLKSDTEEKGIIISSSAIVGSENQPQVYLIKNGKAILQNIVVSKKIKNKSVVSSGLKTGNVIVTNGFINLFDGANVTSK